MTLTPEEEVDAALAKIPADQSRPCAVARNKPLVAALRHFLQQKAEGKTKVSLKWFYEMELQDKHQGPSLSTVRRWVAKEQR